MILYFRKPVAQPVLERQNIVISRQMVFYKYKV